MKHPRVKKITSAKHAKPHKVVRAEAEAKLPAAPKHLRIPDRHIIGFVALETEQVQEIAVVEPLPSREGKVIVPPSVKKRSKKHGQKS